MDNAKQTLKELILGIIIWAILFISIDLLLMKGKVAVFFGILLGSIVAIGNAVSIYKSLDTALDLDVNSSEKKMRKSALIRFGIMGLVVLLAIYFPEIIHLIGVVFGILTLKLSAYLQPIIHKYISKGQDMS